MKPALVGALGVLGALGWTSPTRAGATATASDGSASVTPSDVGATPKPRPALLHYPESPGAFDWRAGAGVLVDVLPTRVVESEQRQIPQITGALRLGLPANFSASVRARAIVISNQLELGAGWSAHVGPVSVALQNHVGAWFGAVGVDGFDATAWGLLETPGVSVGIPWRDLRLSLTEEAVISFSQHTTLGDATTASRRAVTFSGTASTLVVETLLRGGGAPWFGFGLLWTQPDYQAWLAFSDERARILYPRFVAGYGF